MEPERSLEVGPAEAGQRLDAVVARALGLSRGWVRKLLDAERVRLEGKPAAKGAILRAATASTCCRSRGPKRVRSRIPSSRSRSCASSAGLIAVDKPAGLPVHPLGAGRDAQRAERAGRAAPRAGRRRRRRPALGRGAPTRHRHVGRAGVRAARRRLAGGARGLRREARREALPGARARRVRRRARGRAPAREPRQPRARGRERRPTRRVAHPRARDRRRHEPGRGRSCAPAFATRSARRWPSSATPIVGDRVYGSPVALERHLLHAASIAWDAFAAESEPPPELRPRTTAAR